MMRRVAAISASLMLVCPVAALADWGGAAVNANTGHYGYSAGWDSRGEARSSAMQFCNQFSSNAPGCDVVVLTQQCAALARVRVGGSIAYFVSEARTDDTAASNALNECRAAHGASCELARSFCADDL